MEDNINKLADCMINYYKCNIDINKKQEAIMRYAFLILFNTILSLSVAIIPAIIIGQCSTLIIVLLTNSSLKIFAGGVHSRYSLNCALIGSFITNAIAYLAPYVILLDDYTKILIIVLICSITFIIFRKYSPVDTINKPIKSISKRLKLRKISFRVLCLWVLYYVFCMLTHNISIYCMASVLTVLWQGVSMTNIMSKINTRIDYYVCFITREGR